MSGRCPSKPYGPSLWTMCAASKTFLVPFSRPSIIHYSVSMRRWGQVSEAWCGCKMHFKDTIQQKASKVHPDLTNHTKSAQLGWPRLLSLGQQHHGQEGQSTASHTWEQTWWPLRLLRLQQIKFPGAWTRPLHSPSAVPLAHLCLTCNTAFSTAFRQAAVAIQAHTHSLLSCLCQPPCDTGCWSNMYPSVNSNTIQSTRLCSFFSSKNCRITRRGGWYFASNKCMVFAHNKC